MSVVQYGNTGYTMATVPKDPVNMGAVYGFLIVEWIVIMVAWLYLHQVRPV